MGIEQEQANVTPNADTAEVSPITYREGDSDPVPLKTSDGEVVTYSHNAPIDWDDRKGSLIPSYPKVFAVGHRGIPELFVGPVLVEEKVDGSQFSFMYSDMKGLSMRSKGATVYENERHNMFGAAVMNIVNELLPFLHPGWIYRVEYLQKPKHNTLAYDRVPKLNMVVYDIEAGPGNFLSRAEKVSEATRIGLEVVPLIFEGELIHKSQLVEMLNHVSFLGGQQIEGVVVKNYAQFGADKKVQMGKFVREDFKELNAKAWKSDPDKTVIDIKEKLGRLFNSPARFEKAIQHLRDAGKLEGSPRDIGNLINEVQRDIVEEEKPRIEHELYRWAIKHILRISTAGLPEWYKQRLVDQAFEQKEQADVRKESEADPGNVVGGEVGSARVVSPEE